MTSKPPPHDRMLSPGESATDFPRISMRIGFDFAQAGPRFKSFVKARARDLAASTGGLKAMDITLKPTQAIPELRKLTFWYVDLEGTLVEISEKLREIIPWTQVFANQYYTDIRDSSHIHALATGITAWLVCVGEAAAAPSLLPPEPDPGPPTTPTGGTNVVEYEFRKAA